MRLFLLIALGAAALPVAAQPRMAPGLWETRMQVQQGGASVDAMAQMQKQLAAMPPEQRKQVEQMMAQRGVAPGGAGPGGTGVKVCISKDQAARCELPSNEGERCKRESLSSEGNTMKFKFSCSDPASTGEGQFTFASEKAYSGRLVVDSIVNGKPQRTEMQQTGQWLGADCGTLKPREKPESKW